MCVIGVLCILSGLFWLVGVLLHASHNLNRFFFVFSFGDKFLDFG